MVSIHGGAAADLLFLPLLPLPVALAPTARGFTPDQKASSSATDVSFAVLSGKRPSLGRQEIKKFFRGSLSRAAMHTYGVRIHQGQTSREPETQQ